MLANIRFEQENDALAYELVTTKVSLRAKLDEVGNFFQWLVYLWFHS
jgi:hypothetical protein